MTTSHTPGPWFVDGMGNDPDCLAICAGERPEGPDSQRESKIAEVHTPEDARLIAAAPDLLAALAWLAEELGDPAAPKRASVEAMQSAREAIAKAEGKA